MIRCAGSSWSIGAMIRAGRELSRRIDFLPRARAVKSCRRACCRNRSPAARARASSSTPFTNRAESPSLAITERFPVVGPMLQQPERHAQPPAKSRNWRRFAAHCRDQYSDLYATPRFSGGARETGRSSRRAAPRHRAAPAWRDRAQARRRHPVRGLSCRARPCRRKPWPPKRSASRAPPIAKAVQDTDRQGLGGKPAEGGHTGPSARPLEPTRSRTCLPGPSPASRTGG